MLLRISCFSVFLLLSSFVLADSSVAKWGYKGNIAPEQWGNLHKDFKLCSKGKEQSPINITDTTKTTQYGIEYHYSHTPVNLELKSHDLFNNIDYQTHEYLVFKNQKYYLQGFHFHEPSEHTINGNYYPMEMHLIHKNAEGKLLVVGVFVKEGKENKNLDQLFAKPLAHKDHASIKIETTQFIPEDSAYYVYPGSLTTPPCSEGVTWIVMKQPITASKQQLKFFETNVVRDNARSIQPLNGRKVLEHE